MNRPALIVKEGSKFTGQICTVLHHEKDCPTLRDLGAHSKRNLVHIYIEGQAYKHPCGCTHSAAEVSLRFLDNREIEGIRI